MTQAKQQNEVDFNTINPTQWTLQAEALLEKYWGQLEAFKSPESTLITVEDLFKGIKPKGDPKPAGQAYDAASRLAMQSSFIKREKNWNEIAPTFYTVLDALNVHFDNDKFMHKARLKSFGLEDLYEEGPYEIEPIEEWRARLLLNRFYGAFFSAQGLKSNRYLSNVEVIEWLKDGKPSTVPETLTEKTNDLLKTLEKGWEEILKISRPVERHLATKQLAKDLKVTPNEFQKLVMELMIEGSKENNQFTTFGSLMKADLHQESLVDRLLSSATCSMLAGDTCSGKSSLLYQIAEAVTTGAPLFGQLETKQVNVLTIQADESHINAKRKMEIMQLKADPSNWQFLWAWSPSQMHELQERIEREKIQLVQMDSFGTLFGGTAGSMNDAECGLYLYELNKIAARTGAAIQVNHHLNKGNRKADEKGNEWKPSISDLFGSSYIANGVRDAWAIWKRGEDTDGSPMFGLRYLKDNSGLMERDYTMFLNGCEESNRFNLHEGKDGGIEDFNARNTIRDQLHLVLKTNAGDWLTFEKLKSHVKTKIDRTDRAIKRELAKLVADAVRTGIERREVKDGQVGRPKYEYRYGR